MPLHTDYRPEELDQIVGNETLTKAIRAAITRDNPFKTFLLTGPSGCGKTTIARILKNELGISQFDFKYYNASNTRGIDTIREVIMDMQFAPMDGKYKMYVFDECHQLTPQAQEALLKDTEEPLPHIFFVFCTTDPDRLKTTFKRRGFQGQVEKLIRKDIISLLKDVLEAELEFHRDRKAKINARNQEAKKTDKKIAKLEQIPGEILSAVADAADGSPGQALKLLDQVVDMDDLSNAIDSLQVVFGDEVTILELAQTIADQRIQVDTKWKKAQELLKAMEMEPEVIRKGILTYLGKVMLGGGSSVLIRMMITIFSESTMYSYKAGLVAQCHEACYIGE